MKKQVEQLINLLQVKASESQSHNLKKFNEIEGATSQELQNLERNCEVTLPEDLKEFYKEKNGSGYHFHVLNVEYNEGQRESLYLYSIQNIIENNPLFGYNEFVQEDDAETIEHYDERIKPCFSNENWVPFAQVGSGSTFLLLDYDPTPKGKPGQIIIYTHDTNIAYYVAETFEELLKKSNDFLAELDAIK